MAYRAYMFGKALIAASAFGFPSRKLECYGVTGTDGKSTTNEILYHMMKKAWLNVGIISTVSIDVGEGKNSNLTKLTSVSHRTFQKLLRTAVRNWLTHMVIEPSSHAMYQFRLRPVKFSGVWFTNLTREHLDFHWTMDHYFRTKFRLFREYAKRDSVGIIPQWFEFWALAKSLSCVGDLRTFGYDDTCSVWVENIKENPHLFFDMYYSSNTSEVLQGSVKTQTLWVFNAENMMIATTLAMKAWVSREECMTSLRTFWWLPGRQELVVGWTWITAMIDFALTPDGLTTLYKAVRSLWFKKQIAIFGATWNRDQWKRPIMWWVAVQYNDYTIITEDENYHEDGMEIMRAVEWWIDTSIHKDDYELVQDRTAAITRGLELAQPGDIVIITWMANFTSRAMNEGEIPWNERAVIEECMEKLGIR